MKLIVASFFLACVGCVLATQPIPEPPSHPDKSAEAVGDDQNGGVTGRVALTALLWPINADDVAEVPFILDGFDEAAEALIRRHMLMINTRTCVHFVDRNGESDYIKIVNGGGCSSDIGHQGGEQIIHLESPRCFSERLPGTIYHMLMHSLAFLHEHQRPDRDQYVTVNMDNVCPGQESHFELNSEASTFGRAYDYGSVMHFSRTAFSKCDPDVCEPAQCVDPDTQSDTMLPTDGGVNSRHVNVMGQRQLVSILDIGKIRAAYACPKKKIVSAPNQV